MYLEVLPYCDSISSNRIKFYIKATNGVPYYRDALEFRIEGDATNSNVPMMVKLDIKSDVNQSDLDKLKSMIKNAPNVTTNEYTQESYVYFQRTIREATNLAYSNNPGQTEVKEMINKLAGTIDKLEKIENTVGDMKKIKSLNFENDMYLQDLSGLEYDAIDLDGKKIKPSKVVLSPNVNPQVLNLEDVLVDGKIRIDSSLTKGHKSLEVLYESEYNSGQHDKNGRYKNKLKI
ncbi:MAG: hypothetical protein ACRDD7_09710 [Peptostreptococcaceae bacterium]